LGNEIAPAHPPGIALHFRNTLVFSAYALQGDPGMNCIKRRKHGKKIMRVHIGDGIITLQNMN